MGSGLADRLDAVHPLCRARIQPDLLGLLCGLRIFCERLPSVRRGFSLAAWGAKQRNIETHARGHLVAGDLLWGHYGFVLVVRLHRTDHSLRCDYIMSDSGGLARRKVRPMEGLPPLQPGAAPSTIFVKGAGFYFLEHPSIGDIQTRTLENHKGAAPKSKPSRIWLERSRSEKFH
jgi:hypothetical protein